MQFVHVGLTVQNLAASMEFYKLLGFSPVRNSELSWEGYLRDKNEFYRFPEGTSGIVQYCISENGFELELFQWNTPGKASGVNWLDSGIHHIAFRTSDLNSVYTALKSHNYKILLEPRNGLIQKFMFVEDPDGNHIEIAQPYNPSK